MDLDTAHKCILQIQEDKNTLSNRELENKWKYFSNEYPLIFITLQKEDVDPDMLMKLITQLKMVQRGTKSQDEAERAFGETLNDKFIYDKFQKPSQEELDKAYEKGLKIKEKALKDGK